MKHDQWTIMAVAALAWVILMVGHEALGHGLTCVFIGGEPRYIDAMYFDCRCSDAGFWAKKFYIAGGSLFNIVWASICWVLLSRIKSPHVAFFFWISAIYNFFQAGAYIAFGRYIHEGMDWAVFLEGFDPVWPWHLALWVVGLLSIVAGFRVAWYHQALFFAPYRPTKKQTRYFFLTLLGVSTAISTSASCLVPTDDRFMLIMGGVGNGFTFMLGLVVLAFVPIPKVYTRLPLSLEPEQWVYGLGLGAALLYIGMMAPGISF